MPITHRVNTERRVLLVTREGSISRDEEEASLRARKQDPSVVSGMPVLVDSRSVHPPDSVSTVRYLADVVTHNANRLDCGPLALVVGSPVQYGMARMYIALTELAHPATQVFTSYEEAISWLATGTAGAGSGPE